MSTTPPKAKIVGMPKHNTQYEVHVIFLRELADDRDILENTPSNDGLPFEIAAAEQLAREIQECYSDGAIGGQFAIVANGVKIGSEGFQATLFHSSKRPPLTKF